VHRVPQADGAYHQAADRAGNPRRGTRPEDVNERQKSMTRTASQCAYCGATDSLTVDHVPPKNMFPKPRPNDLITVPACSTCNSSASKDDEYFRLTLCLSEQVGTDANARQNRDTIFRSLERDEAVGFRTALVADIRPVRIRTPTGLDLGTRLGFDVDLQRIFGVVERTVRGLFFHEAKRRLDPNYDVRIFSDDTLIENSPEVLKELRNTILIPLAQKSPTVIANGAFHYRFQITDEDPSVSVWALSFYEGVSFLGLTGPHVKTA